MTDPIPTDPDMGAVAASWSHTDPARRLGRQRRPTGAPPPLPRSVGRSGRVWLAAMAYVFVASIIAFRTSALERLATHNDTWILARVASLRTPWATHLARAIKVFGSGWPITVIGLALVASLMIFRRWRHLLVFLGSLFVLLKIGDWLYQLVSRPRPYGVRIIGGWGGFSLPSPPIAIFTMTAVGILYTLIPHGRLRDRAKWWAAGSIAVLALARLYLGVDHPSDVVFGAVLCVAISITMFRLLTPWEVFPVVYRKGSMAHLDITGRRGDAIRQAALEQLGLGITEIKPFGLEGSGGSTPLRLRIEGEPEAYVFAKLYAKTHVRADRWYKLWRTILYGTLEDEASFQTVRRFVEYEDYTLRLVWGAGIPTAEPYGIVEITPGSEYMLVMGFEQGAVEIGEAEVDDSIIDQGLQIVRKLWDAGLAHRDIKPANLIVKDGRLILIDLFFVQVRPSPWRQAVDLANMMLVLAVRTDPERVYRRALHLFKAEEIAEAFAATRGVASPTQLRSFLKKDPRDLLAQFRDLAPRREPIRIQRLSVRRVLIGLGMLGAFVIGIQAGIGAFLPLQDLPVSAPECGTGHALILVAQSVPRSTMIPCLASLPSGWQFGGAQVHTNRTRFWLDSDRAGRHAVEVTLTSSCVVSPRDRVPSDQPGAQRFEEPSMLRPRLVDRRIYVFPGGCVMYDFDFAPGAPSSLVFAVDSAVSFEPRATLVSYLRRSQHAELCGAGGRCVG